MSILPGDLWAVSLSDRELVLPLALAFRAIELLEQAGVTIIAWEGWLRHADGRVGLSARHQGTASLTALSASSAAAFCRKTIAQDQQEWDRGLEVPGASLWFCITY